jgi:ABC-type multidrug transport system ATPase subunit
VQGKKGNSSNSQKKAVLLSGNPGMGKTTTARLVCQLLGYEALEVLKFFVPYFSEEQHLRCCLILSNMLSESSPSSSLLNFFHNYYNLKCLISWIERILGHF